MEKNSLSENSRLKTAAYFVISSLLFCWPLIFVGKGIDFSDTSFYLAGYKWAFEMESGISSDTAFSTFIGALIYRLLPEAHLLVFRILDVLVYAVVILCARKICVREEKILLAAAMLGGAFFLKDGPMTLSYNSFSVLNFALALYLLLTGLEKRDKKILFLSGFVTGINLYFRVPNLLQISMVFAVCLYGLKEKWSGKGIILNMAIYYAGYMLAFAAGFAVLCILIGADNALADYIRIADMGASSSTSHGVGNMLGKIISQFADGLKFFAPLFAGSVLLSFIVVKAKVSDNAVFHRCAKAGAVLAIFGGALYGLVVCNFLWTHLIFYILMSVAVLIGVISFAFFRRSSSRGVVWAWFLLIVVGCMASGTDIAFVQIRSSGVLIIGLAVALLLLWRDSAGDGPVCGFDLKIIATAWLTFVMVLSIVMPVKQLLFTYTYRDASYPYLTETVKAPELKGMLTTPEKAYILDTFYDDVEQYGLENFELATAGHFSPAYFISDCRPFFNRSWPDLDSFSTEKYKAVIEQKTKDGCLPVIAVVDTGTGIFTSSTSQEKYELLMELTTKYEFRCVRNEDTYRLYVPVI